jgi:hypothetical protein
VGTAITQISCHIVAASIVTDAAQSRPEGTEKQRDHSKEGYDVGI